MKLNEQELGKIEVWMKDDEEQKTILISKTINELVDFGIGNT